MYIKIDCKNCGNTVLEILKKELRLSSKFITALKSKENGITVNGERVTVRKKLSPGDILSIKIEDDENNENLIPTEMPLDIIFEDDDIILVNKPPMMPTHPSHGHFDDTLANGICFHMIINQKAPFVFRSVNRLDRNTSGIVLVAKNRISAQRLYSSMQKGEIKKTYIALLCGEISPNNGIIDTFIRRKEASIITREVCGPLADAARAITEYTVLSCVNNITAVKACPITGRTHQLRLHFAHLGAPVLGDDLYGTPSDVIDRQALHAYTLSFPHPKSGELLLFTAPLMEDMRRVISDNNLKIEV